MPTYRVVSGTHRSQDGERVAAGDTIELPESVADDFPQKFERVEAEAEADSTDEEPSATTADTVESEDEGEDSGSDEESLETALSESSDEPETADADEPGPDADGDGETPKGTESDDIGDTEAAADIPDDYSLLSKMAKHYDGDEIHGSMAGANIKGFLETLSHTEVANLKTKAREEMSGN